MIFCLEHGLAVFLAFPLIVADEPNVQLLSFLESGEKLFDLFRFISGDDIKLVYPSLVGRENGPLYEP